MTFAFRLVRKQRIHNTRYHSVATRLTLFLILLRTWLWFCEMLKNVLTTWVPSTLFHSFSTVRPSGHINPARNRSFLLFRKRSSRRKHFKMPALCFSTGRKHQPLNFRKRRTVLPAAPSYNWTSQRSLQYIVWQYYLYNLSHCQQSFLNSNIFPGDIQHFYDSLLSSYTDV